MVWFVERTTSSGRARFQEIRIQHVVPTEFDAPTTMAALTGRQGWLIGDIGGSGMTAHLGPDYLWARGTTTSAQSLPALMPELRAASSKNWIAGHLLNEELGGNGTLSQNLTPLTSAANSAHKVFETHIKAMLTACAHIEDDFKSLTVTQSAGAAERQFPYFYGVRYRVTVSPERYAQNPDPLDLHSYVASYIDVDYRFFKYRRNRHAMMTGASNVQLSDITANAYLARLHSTGNPQYQANSSNVEVLPGGAPPLHFRYRIQNEA